MDKSWIENRRREVIGWRKVHICWSGTVWFPLFVVPFADRQASLHLYVRAIQLRTPHVSAWPRWAVGRAGPRLDLRGAKAQGNAEAEWLCNAAAEPRKVSIITAVVPQPKLNSIYKPLLGSVGARRYR